MYGHSRVMRLIANNCAVIDNFDDHQFREAIANLPNSLSLQYSIMWQLVFTLASTETFRSSSETIGR